MLKYLDFYRWLQKHITYSRIYISVLLLISIVILYSVWFYSKNYYEKIALDKFNKHVVENLDMVEKQISLYENILRSGIGFFHGSKNVRHQNWHHFVKALNIETQYPGMQGIGFSMIIHPNHILEIEQKMRDDGFTNFSIYPAGKREEYSAILYLEPMNQRNLQAIGYDMYSESIRREAMNYTRDTGLPSITGKVTLVQEIDSDVQSGILMYQPLYKKGAKIDTIQDRRKALDGFVYSPFRMNDFMNKIVVTRSMLNFTIYDNEDMSENSLLYRSLKQSSYIPKFKTIKTLHIYNRTWYINLSSTPEFDASTDSKFPLLITLTGLIVNLFLILIILALIKSRQRIKAQAKKNEKLSSYMLSQSRLAQMGEMINMITHQWRQPLASISVIAGTLSLDVMMDKYNSLFFQEQLDSITELSEHLSSTIDDFRGFFKDDKKEQYMEIKELIDETLHIIGSSIESKNIKVDFEYKEKINIYSSINELKQVILNILHNAEEALMENINHDAKILISWYKESNKAYICIEDNAGGIPKEIIKTIFDPYFTTKGDKDGTGLGLYMSKMIIEDHCRGKLTAVNTAYGAKFIIELPSTSKSIK